MNVDEFLKMDPYEKVAQQGQIHPLLPAYVPNPMELDEHVPVHVLEPEHLEYHTPLDDDIQVEDDDEDPEEGPSEEHEPEDSDETEPFEEDETAFIDAFSVGSSLFPLPPTSPSYDQAPLGHRTAIICMRDDIPEEDMPPRRRFILMAPSPGCDVAESFAAATARAPRGLALLARLKTLETHMSRIEWQRQSTEDLAVTQMMRIHTLEARARTKL
nr:hypothetical protein [Tanacetum cinerariifolium]